MVVKFVNVYEFILKFLNGYDIIIIDDGVNLS